MSDNSNKYCDKSLLDGPVEEFADESRLKWEKTYGNWFPAAQKCRYCHIDRVYKEIRDKYGDNLFRFYAQERRLNKRIFRDVESNNDDEDNYTEFKLLKPFVMNGSFPTTYFEHKCGKPTPCLEFCKDSRNSKNSKQSIHEANTPQTHQ